LTGGSRGIGCAVAEALATEGFEIMEFSRTAPYSYSVRTDLAYPLEAHRTVCDALAGIEPDQVEELLVISNAATLEPIGPVSIKAPDAIVANLNVNITSSVLFIAAVIARFQSARCRKIVANVSAGAAQHGVFGWSLYCASKVAMENFIRSLAIEQQAQAFPFIPVNVDPGVVDTHMHVVASSTPAADFPSSSKFAARRMQGHLTPPAQAAAAIKKLLLSASLTPGAAYDARDAEA
jgi:benzil reductase ((S)-benzoin forming)